MFFRTACYSSRRCLAILSSRLPRPRQPGGLGWTIDAIAAEDYEALRILSPLAFIGLAAVRGLGGFMGSYYLAGISNHLVHKLRCELIDRLIRLPTSYFDKNSSGRLVSKLTYDVMQITGAASNAAAVVVRERLHCSRGCSRILCTWTGNSVLPF